MHPECCVCRLLKGDRFGEFPFCELGLGELQFGELRFTEPRFTGLWPRELQFRDQPGRYASESTSRR
jgi:hypothetical protein